MSDGTVVVHATNTLHAKATFTLQCIAVHNNLYALYVTLQYTNIQYKMLTGVLFALS